MGQIVIEFILSPLLGIIMLARIWSFALYLTQNVYPD